MGKILSKTEEESLTPAIEREEKLMRLMTEKCFQPMNRTHIFQDKFLPALHELIGPQLKILNITGFVAHCPSSKRTALIRAAIFRISNYAPKLVRLHVARDRKLRGVQWEEKIYADDEIVEALSKLKELQILQLEVTIFNLPNLLKLSARLIHLHLISTNLTEILALPDVKDLKKSFEGLKVFLFWVQENSTNRRFDTKFNEINHLKIIWTNVGHTPIREPIQQIEKNMKNLTKITSLDLRGVPYMNIFINFLLKFGSKLIALHVADVETYQIKLSYNEVFRDCPKLEKLYLDVADVKERIIVKFPPLKELKLNLERISKDSYSLYDVLRAPELEKIELLGELTYPEDLEKLKPLFYGRPRSLRKLKTIIVNIGWTDVTYRIRQKQIYFKQISSFLRDAMKELKRTLTGVKLSLNDSCEYLQLYNCMHQEAAEEEIESSLGPSFKNANKMNQRPALTEREKELLRLMTEKCFLPVDRVNIFQNIFLPAFHELIGPKLETLNLSGFVDHCQYSERPEKIKQAILDIAIQAPQLVCLHATRERNLRAELWEGNFTADDQIVEALSKLKKLKVLQLEVMSFKLPDLLQLSQGLTHLRLISTNLTEKIALPDVEDLKESFEGLRVFLFWTQANQINRRAFTRFCIEHVPTLQVVGDYAYLRHFTLDLNYEFIPINIDTKFKKINHLKIIWTNEENSDYKTPFRREELLTKLKKIPSLDLRGVPYIKILSLFFNNYGPTLLALHVTDVATHHVRLTYNQVFKHCPRLKKLCLDVDDSAQRITEKFPPLKELKLNLKRFKINSRNLWDVLKAPGLEKIELMNRLLPEQSRGEWGAGLEIAVSETNQAELSFERKQELLTLMMSKCFQPMNKPKMFQETILPAFKELIGPHLTIINITGFVSHCPDLKRAALIRAAIYRIAHGAPSLVCLRAARDRRLRAEILDGKEFIAGDDVLEALLKLKKLQTLQMEELSFNLPNLLQLSARLSHLHLISTNITDDENKLMVDALMWCLQRLKVFLYCTNSASRDCRLARLCIENVPSLQVVGNFASDFCTFDSYNLYTEIIEPGFSDLRHFTFDLNYAYIPTNFPLGFQKVNSLKIIWSGKENPNLIVRWNSLILLKKLTRVKSLHLHGVPIDATLPVFLQSYGANLHTLHVTSDETGNTKLTYNQVFKHCPKLEKLCLDVDDSEEQIFMKFPPLKELKFNMHRFKKVDFITLWEILTAPELEKIEFLGEPDYPETLNKLNSLMNESKNLCKLKTVVVNFGWTNLTERMEEKKSYFQHMSRFLSILAHFRKENLTGIRFSLNDSCEYLEFYNCLELMATGKVVITAPLFRQLFQIVNVNDIPNWLQDVDVFNKLEEFKIPLIQ
ncbi:Hypothetical predicted protein [Cloeon dipterum]|uniref:Uncharacterized protein n=1 Tax=Cloeon dipterum TaxID=197152 RepID=A0A8S1DUM4_9INSE|nr:Hypothetical predicted protein [Cloeon dipterum]